MSSVVYLFLSLASERLVGMAMMDVYDCEEDVMKGSVVGMQDLSIWEAKQARYFDSS